MLASYSSDMMNALCAIPIGLITLCVLGCGGTPAPRVLELRALARGGFSGIQAARQEVIKNSQQWQQTWAEHRGKSTTPCPAVDFSKEMVIIMTMGRQNTGGYSIRVVRAEATRDKLRIQVRRTVPQAGSRAIQVLTAPYEFIAVPRTDLPVEFVDELAKAGK